MTDREEVLGLVTVCQGPPICSKVFHDDEDPEAFTSQCVWCKRITVFDDGSDSVTEPTRA